MKILYITTIGATMSFFESFIKQMSENGNTIDIATNIERSSVSEFFYNLGCKVYPISFSRNPFTKDNIQAYKQIKSVIDGGRYDIIHCHTPVAAMLSRLAARKVRKRGSKVLYTAHGFHFYKRAPLFNWLIYFPIEWICSFFTDVLITINKEDFTFAKKYMHAKKVEYVPGVGLDIDKVENVSVDRKLKREELGIKDDEIAVLSVGELNDNKNHETVIRAIAKLNDKNITYIICGTGEKDTYLRNLAKELGIKLILTGFRNDVIEICKSCDIFAFPSKREGLPVSVMEAMATGLPIICSDIRGNVDLVTDGENGFLCNVTDADEFSEKIRKLVDDKSLLFEMEKKNREIIQKFSIEKVQEKMKKIYDLI